jgi:hypothetical protein
VLRNGEDDREVLLMDELGMRLLLVDLSSQRGLVPFLHRILPPHTAYSVMSHRDHFLNLCLAYLFATERQQAPASKPVLDELAVCAQSGAEMVRLSLNGISLWNSLRYVPHAAFSVRRSSYYQSTGVVPGAARRMPMPFFMRCRSIRSAEFSSCKTPTW